MWNSNWNIGFNLLLPSPPIFHQVWPYSTLPLVIAIRICLCKVSKYPVPNEVPLNKDSYPCISWRYIWITLLFIPSFPNSSHHYLPYPYKLGTLWSYGSCHIYPVIPTHELNSYYWLWLLPTVLVLATGVEPSLMRPVSSTMIRLTPTLYTLPNKMFM